MQSPIRVVYDSLFCLQTARALVGAAMIAAITPACGGSTLPGPEKVAHPHAAYREVPYPPPAALVEVVPARPTEDAVWTDGHWTFQLGRFVWERGGWVRPPPGARLSTWDLVYTDDGRLLFAPDVWRDAQGRAISPPKILAPADPPRSEATGEHATPP